MSDHFIGNEIDSLVKKLAATPTDINLVWDVVKIMETEKEDLQVQLFCYAQDIQKLLTKRDMAQKEKSYQAPESSDLDTIRRLATAAEFKDDDTGAHPPKMSCFSSIIASTYGLDERFCNLLE